MSPTTHRPRRCRRRRPRADRAASAVTIGRPSRRCRTRDRRRRRALRPPARRRRRRRGGPRTGARRRPRRLRGRALALTPLDSRPPSDVDSVGDARASRRSLAGVPPAADASPVPDVEPPPTRPSRPTVVPVPYARDPADADAAAAGLPSGPASWAGDRRDPRGAGRRRWNRPGSLGHAVAPGECAPGRRRRPPPPGADSVTAGSPSPAPAESPAARPAPPAPRAGAPATRRTDSAPRRGRRAAGDDARAGRAPTPPPAAPPPAGPRAGHAEPAPPTRAAAAPAARTPAKPAARTAPSGRLLVRSNPSGAEVFVNGERRGVTPLTLRDLPLGAYAVRVTRAGFAAAEQRVTLDAGRPSRALEVALAARAARRPRPTATGAARDDARQPGRRQPSRRRPCRRRRPRGRPHAGDPRRRWRQAAHAVRIDLTGYLPITTTALRRARRPGPRRRLAHFGKAAVDDRDSGARGRHLVPGGGRRRCRRDQRARSCSTRA